MNTAPVEVLRSFNTDSGPLSEVDASTIVEERMTADIGLEAGLSSLGQLGLMIAEFNYDVKSDYFLLTSQTEFLDRRYTLYSVLRRETGDNGEKVVKVIARSRAAL